MRHSSRTFHLAALAPVSERRPPLVPSIPQDERGETPPQDERGGTPCAALYPGRAEGPPRDDAEVDLAEHSAPSRLRYGGQGHWPRFVKNACWPPNIGGRAGEPGAPVIRALRSAMLIWVAGR